MKQYFVLIAFVSALFCSNSTATAQGKAKVVVKKEFCPPEEFLDESEVEDKLQIPPEGVNEPLVKKCMASLSYSNITAKLTGKYTIVKWKYANHHNEKQIDTLIIITDADHNDRFMYYKKNKSAGKSQPVIINASIASKLFTVGGVKVGMAQLMVDKVFNGKFAINEEQTTYHIKDEPQNNWFSFSFHEGKLQYIGFVGYWD